jgi:Rad3-related DNA helicase
MTNTVFDTLNNSKKTTIEAPTWLWKSFAYLIPSIVYSLKHNKQIIVSTKTKALQDQLYYKDLDFLEKNLWEDFRYTKLKGKNNYICISLFFDEIALSDFDYIKTGFLSKITLWLCDTKFWDFDELKFLNKEYFYKQLISADTYNIKTNTLINDYSSYEFITKAKNRVEESNIIIVNHNLLFSDLVGDYSFLWDIKNIIFDEWHSLEDVVTNALIKGFSLKNVKSIIDIVDKTFNKLSIKKITFIKLTSEIISYLELLEDYWYNYIDNYKNIEIWKYTHILIKDDFFKSIDYKSVLKKIELSFIDLIDLLANKREHDFTKEKRFFENNLDSIKKILNFD